MVIALEHGEHLANSNSTTPAQVLPTADIFTQLQTSIQKEVLPKYSFSDQIRAGFIFKVFLILIP